MTDAATTLEEHLRHLEEELLQADVRRDGDKVAALLADDFVEFGASGRVYDRQQVVAALASEEPAQRTLADFRVVLLAADAALVTYRAVREEAGEESISSLRSSLWVMRRGRWQMIFHQGTRLGGD